MCEAEKQNDDPEVLSRLFSGINGNDIRDLCSNSFERTTYVFKYGSSLMEACIDYGEIKDSAGKTCDIICEMELSLWLRLMRFLLTPANSNAHSGLLCPEVQNERIRL